MPSPNSCSPTSSPSPPLSSLQGAPDIKDHPVLNFSPHQSYHLKLLSSSAELMKEITTLESEIVHLESYLLSLYRTAFEQHLPTLFKNCGTHLECKIGSQLGTICDQSCQEWKTRMQNGGCDGTPPDGFTGSDVQGHAATTKSSRRVFNQVNKNAYDDDEHSQDRKGADPGRCSLADHLGTSCIVNAPNRLSEEIVRCISSVYCKLADPTLALTGFSVSSTSSLSSSSSFSPWNLSDSCSPRCSEEGTDCSQLGGIKEESGPYAAATIEVLKICLDDDSFTYATRMLQKFRSLVKRLEKVDPRKMMRKEKLAFWINIHNALVMHAHLAYGTHTCVKGTYILKATYNVGGHCIDAYVIQNSILGIRSHHSTPWVQTLLSPGKKFKVGSATHVYAIEYAEPLVHFALCSGAFSDPAVRVYTAKNVFENLKLAREEFLQASVYIHKKWKMHLPKILFYYAKDASLTMPGLLEMVSACLSAVEQKEAIKRCMNKDRPEKYIYWLPQSSAFRYLIHRDVVATAGRGISCLID